MSALAEPITVPVAHDRLNPIRRHHQFEAAIRLATYRGRTVL
ncbi:hypothetical protein BLA18110_06694 [Burkholderia lata]|nr:hypothetical protein BLA18110_06694 [Burkholderia lata]